MNKRKVAVTGATGYLGRQVTLRLIERGHEVHAIVRAGSEQRVPRGVAVTTADVFSHEQLATALRGSDTVVHLIGIPRPSPLKAAQFLRVDLASVRACARAAADAGVEHFVYVSVAQPAPVMRAYVNVRMEAERIVTATGLTRTFVRPWYVLGPGHRWPVALLPFYALARILPATREAAQRLGLVSLPQMICALVNAVEQPPHGGEQRIVGVPDIRRSLPLEAV
jgi:uncharacterized protein YbjT (DUF2867 family)